MSKGKLAGRMLLCLLIAYALTGVLVLAFAWITYKMNLGDRVIGFMAVFIYIFANAVSGLLMGHYVKKKQYLWGMLLGFCYGMLLLLISALASGGLSNIAADSTFPILLCIGGGTLGGMIS